VTVPWVEDGQYTIILFGDSGNVSPTFTILESKASWEYPNMIDQMYMYQEYRDVEHPSHSYMSVCSESKPLPSSVNIWGRRDKTSNRPDQTPDGDLQ
jgi:hypothetical protein